MTAEQHGTTGDDTTGVQTPEKGHRAVFRIPGTALIGVLMLFMCMFPFAATLPYLLPLLIVPIAVAIWIMRTRTVATRDGLEVRTMLGTRQLPWDALKGFSLTPKASVVAVLSDDTKVALPSVRTRHLPVLSLVSEGRVPDPSGLLSEPADEPEKNEDGTGAAGSDAEGATDARAGENPESDRTDDTVSEDRDAR
ncbi:PH domain-containing protein [Saccharomonospora azurea]|uniref:PH domain-containing protein n=1 Tax=Saccharomonospora azurea TaxID=40988 RepID=UPI00331D25E1